jgi:predicted nucleotidyltransferase
MSDRAAASTIQRKFSEALDALVAQVKADRSILAAILCGSMSHDTVWAKSDIDLELVTVDEKKVETSHLALYAGGVNVHAFLMPRSAFRKTVEGSVRNSFMHYRYLELSEPPVRYDCAACPRTGEPAPSRTASQILEAILSLPEGAEIELRAPVFQQYGEELNFVLTEVRKKGCRLLIVDGKPLDISAEVDLDESKVENMDAVVDRFVVSRKHEKAIKAGIAATLLVGDGLLQVQIVKGASKAEAERFYRGLASPAHHFVYGDIQPEYFMLRDRAADRAPLPALPPARRSQLREGGVAR